MFIMVAEVHIGCVIHFLHLCSENIENLTSITSCPIFFDVGYFHWYVSMTPNTSRVSNLEPLIPSSNCHKHKATQSS